MLPRTITSAQTTPNTVFTTTAIAATKSVSLNGVERLRGRDRPPGAVEILGRPPHHHEQRPDEDQGEVAERDEPEREPTHARAS